MKLWGSEMGPMYTSLCMRTQVCACIHMKFHVYIQLWWPNFKQSQLTQFNPKLGKICIQIEAQDFYFSMQQISLINKLWIKSYGQNNEQKSFFSIVFKVIWALLSCDYFQTIKITSITFYRHSKLIIGTRD